MSKKIEQAHCPVAYPPKKRALATPRLVWPATFEVVRERRETKLEVTVDDRIGQLR